MKKFMGFLAFVAGLGMAVSATAAPVSIRNYDLGALSSGSNVALTKYVYNTPTGAFSDNISFSLSSPSVLESMIFADNSNQRKNINNLTLSLYNSSSTLLETLGSGDDITLSGIAPAGNYYAVVSGNSTGTKGGLFTGAFVISAVPEASTWSMMLVGVTLLGFTASRKKV